MSTRARILVFAAGLSILEGWSPSPVGISATTWDCSSPVCNVRFHVENRTDERIDVQLTVRAVQVTRIHGTSKRGARVVGELKQAVALEPLESLPVELELETSRRPPTVLVLTRVLN